MKVSLTFFLIGCFLTSQAQDKNQFFALDAKMNQTVLDSSKYILWVHETDSARWQWDYYYTWGPLVKSTRYADHDGTLKDGRFSLYNSAGDLDSTGLFDHGKKNGSFCKFKTYAKDSVVSIRQNIYLQDSLVKSVDLLTESHKNIITDTTNEKESSYPGGTLQWQNFIVKNLRYPERAQTKNIQGEVRICFKIDRDGNISDPYIQKSAEYSLDEEALRLINQSGKWDPAISNGIPVDSYKVQPFTFKLDMR
jgi:periplasmic protein TonB